MARIRRVEESEATGEIAAAYAEWMAANPGRSAIPEILKCFSSNAAVFRDVEGISNHLHFADGHLAVRTKEMIATFVSALNRCPYCTQSPAYFLHLQEPDARVHSCLARADLDSAPISGPEREMLRFVELVTKESYRTTDDDVDALRRVGWSDPQIAECVHVTALFAFFNRVANAFGLEDPGYFRDRPSWWGTPP